LKSRSIKFETTSYQDVARPVCANTPGERRQQLQQWLKQCRLGTLALFEQLDEATFCYQAHSDFSPVGWHLGHIAFTESLWLLEHCAGMAPLFPEYRRLLVADGLPKSERVKLPTQEAIRHYLDAVREQVLRYLETADLERQERLWRWVVQHESQHSETIAFLLQLQRWQEESRGAGEKSKITPLATTGETPATQWLQNLKSNISSYLTPDSDEMVRIPAGYFEQGNDAIDALDNERPVHQVYLDAYWIDRYPVTCGQYRLFMEAGGYQNHHWWSKDGWRWVQSQMVTQPLYWSDNSQWDNHPVCGVSWYEAEAYASFVGKRLPTEPEWEKAASWNVTSGDSGDRRTYPWGEAAPDNHRCNHNNLVGQTTPVNTYPDGQSAYGCYDMLGNVWEWTASVFDGYQGFMSYPYPGYSKVYFDGQHQVLKGGSWATRPWALRSSFRNWYHPGIRQILAGFRCASSQSMS
jgi:ergothioneine biosynthesis protein EgtB